MSYSGVKDITAEDEHVSMYCICICLKFSCLVYNFFYSKLRYYRLQTLLLLNDEPSSKSVFFF